MENEYVLYLDESKTIDNVFVIGGFAIKLRDEAALNNDVKKIKRETWPSLCSKGIYPIFHACDYFKKKPDGFFEIVKALRKYDGKVFACVLKLDELYELYGYRYKAGHYDEFKIVEDEFYICLQKVIEGYTHFLYTRNGFGKTVYEGRNSVDQNWFHSPDFLLKSNYQKIVANNKGLLYISEDAVRYCNTGFSVKTKAEDSGGLQIADTIAYVIAKSMSPSVNIDHDFSNLFEIIYKMVYNGNFDINEKDLRNFYGVKILPEMYRTLRMEREIRDKKKYYVVALEEMQKKMDLLDKLKKEENKNGNRKWEKYDK